MGQRSRGWVTLGALACAVALGGCGGGSDGAPAAPTPTPTPTPTPATVRWVTTAPQNDLSGSADGGVDGALRMVDPTRPGSLTVADPATVDSTALRVMGSQVDATLGSATAQSPRFVVFDAAVSGSAGSIGLFKLPLDGSLTAPVAQRLSSASQICSGTGGRFSMLGQSLAGDAALFHFSVPTVATACADGGEPRVVTLAAGAAQAPIELPAGAAERLTPVGPVHGSTGQIAAFLAWRQGGFVRTDATLGSPTALGPADLAEPVTAAAEPRGPGIVTRFGIFVLSNDGLRRYDKSTGRLSALLVPGRVAVGTRVEAQFDETALYVTAIDAGGRRDLWRVTDSASPVATRLNTEGPLAAIGLRVLKSYVLYAVEGRTDWVAWRKSDGVRSNVLDGRDVVLASTLHDRVFHSGTDGSGATVVASSEVDGTQERALGRATVLAGSIADVVSPFSRQLRGNGAFSHAVVVVPAAGGSGVGGAAVRWASFGAASEDLDGGTLPANASGTPESPGVVGNALLFGLRNGGAADLFVVRRAAGTLARAGTTGAGS